MHGIYRYIYNCHGCYPPPYMDGRTETAATTTPSPSRVSLSLSLSQCVCVCVSTGVVVCAWVCLSLCVCVVLERDGQSWRVRPRRNPLWAPVVLTPTTAAPRACALRRGMRILEVVSTSGEGHRPGAQAVCPAPVGQQAAGDQSTLWLLVARRTCSNKVVRHPPRHCNDRTHRLH